MLLGLLLAKVLFDPHPVGDFGRDGSYYYQVARHVAEGRGLQTSVSLFRQGLRPLPHASTVYPAWPLLLGGVGAIVGLDDAASLVPEALYFGALLLLYVLANAVASAWGEPTVVVFRGRPLVDVGHLAVALLGFNRIFFKYTSLPYADGLALCFAFGALGALVPLASRPSRAWAVLCGCLAALAFLTRSQMFGLVLAIPASLLLAGFRSPRYRLVAGLALGTSIAGITPWLAYLVTSVDRFEIAMLVDFTTLHEMSELPPYRWNVATDSLREFVADRASGLLVAFDPVGRMSYVVSFGPIAYLPPAVLLLLVARPRALASALRSTLDRRWLVVVGCSAAAAACLAPVHLAHENRHWGWFFNFRHGLPLILAVVVTLGFSLVRGRRLLRLLAWALTLASLVWNVAGVMREIGARYRGPTGAESAFGAWIATQAPAPVFLTTQPWSLGAVTRGLFHGVDCGDPPDHTRVYLEHAGVDYVVTQSFDLECAFFVGVQQELVPVRKFGSGAEQISVWRPAPREAHSR